MQCEKRTFGFKLVPNSDDCPVPTSSTGNNDSRKGLYRLLLAKDLKDNATDEEERSVGFLHPLGGVVAVARAVARPQQGP